jgi:plasmid stability protein
MAQLVVRNIEDTVKEGLRARALTHGRSLEEEVRVILRSAVYGDEENEEGLGTRLAKLFEGNGIDFELPKMDEWPIRVTFDE